MLFHTQDIFYKDDENIVRRSVPNDALILKYSMRQSDRDEVFASHNLSPLEALIYSLKNSVLSLTIEHHNKPIAMFGVGGESVLGDKGVIWFLSSKKLETVKLKFLRRCKDYIRLMLELYPYLYNYVHVKNEAAIQWLKFCGAKFKEAAPHGINQEMFFYFSFERGGQ